MNAEQRLIPKPFALCQVACVRGVWAFRVVSHHTTARAALNRASFAAALGGLYRVMESESGSWVGELDGRGAGALPVPSGVEMVEVAG